MSKEWKNTSKQHSVGCSWTWQITSRTLCFHPCFLHFYDTSIHADTNDCIAVLGAVTKLLLQDHLDVVLRSVSLLIPILFIRVTWWPEMFIVSFGHPLHTVLSRGCTYRFYLLMTYCSVYNRNRKLVKYMSSVGDSMICSTWILFGKLI